MNPNYHPSVPYLLMRCGLAVALLLMVQANSGCAHRKGGHLAPTAGQESGPSDPTFSGTGETWTDAAPGGLEDNVPLSGRPGQIHFDSARVQKDLVAPVYFAFDRYDVASSELPKIRQVAQRLRQGSSGVIIAGHTDSSGTTEYNRNLGERRALAIRSALLQEGVSVSQVQTVSFGEDRPAQAGETESCHAANRRAEFGLFDSVSR